MMWTMRLDPIRMILSLCHSKPLYLLIFKDVGMKLSSHHSFAVRMGIITQQHHDERSSFQLQQTPSSVPFKYKMLCAHFINRSEIYIWIFTKNLKIKNKKIQKYLRVGVGIMIYGDGGRTNHPPGLVNMGNHFAFGCCRMWVARLAHPYAEILKWSYSKLFFHIEALRNRREKKGNSILIGRYSRISIEKNLHTIHLYIPQIQEIWLAMQFIELLYLASTHLHVFKIILTIRLI